MESPGRNPPWVLALRRRASDAGRCGQAQPAAESVVHVRYATRPRAPWAGISPLGMADETRALAGWIERRLAEETSTSTSYVLPVPEGGAIDQLKADIKAGRGRLHLVDTTAGGWGGGTAVAPARIGESSAWARTHRTGSEPYAVTLRSDILGIYGVPSSIHGTGGSARESYGRCWARRLRPWRT